MKVLFADYTYDLEYIDFAGMTDLQKASALWAESVNGLQSYISVFTAEGDSEIRSFFNEGELLEPVILVCWTFEGKYYYKEISLAREFKTMLDDLNGVVASIPSPDGKQWAFTWMQMGGVPTVLDFGLSLDGQCVVAYDPVVMGAPEGTPYQIFNMLAYKFEPVDETSGKLILTTVNMFGEEISQEFEYSNYTGNSCHFEFDETSFVGEPVDGTLTEVVVDMTGGVM